MIFMAAPGYAPDMTFAGAPSGAVYESNQYGLIYVGSGGAPDQAYLQAAGCATLTPFGAYALPQATQWKLAATGCAVHSGYSGVNDAKVMSCRVHYATTPLSTIKLSLSNWLNTSNVGDYWGDGTANMGPITVNGTICYPGPNNVIGSYSTVVVPLGQTIDVVITLAAAIPALAKFYEGVYVVPASGCQVPVTNLNYDSNGTNPLGPSNPVNVNTAIGEGSWVNSSATDLTASLSTISSNPAYNGHMYGAVAISSVQPVTTPTVALSGDSLTAGSRCGADGFNNTGPLAWAFGNAVAVLNMGCSGKTADSDVHGGFSGTGYESAMSAREDLMVRCGVTHVIVLLGTNDVFGSSNNAATIEGDLAYIYDELAHLGYTVWAATMPPQTTSTDSFVTVANQSVTARESVRTAVNTWSRSNPVNVVGVLECCAPVESSPGSGKWAAPPAGTPEGVHWYYGPALAVAGQVPVSRFSTSIPASVIGYADTYRRGQKTTQSALDYLMSTPRVSGIATGLAASTTHTLLGATQLGAGINIINTVANSGDAVTLAGLTNVGASMVVYNEGAHAAAVFPPLTTVAIDGGSIGASVMLTNSKRCEFRLTSATTIESAQLGAPSA
jgi:hypothetical protein